MDVFECRYMCVSGGAFTDCTSSDIFSFSSLSRIDFYLLIRYCMTNSFTTVSRSQFKICSPSGFAPYVHTKTTGCHRMTHPSLALTLHTPDVYKCTALLYFLILFDLLPLSPPSILGDTHAHLCIQGCRSN